VIWCYQDHTNWKARLATAVVTLPTPGLNGRPTLVTASFSCALCMTLEAFAVRTQTNDERKEKLQQNAEIT